MLRRIGIILMIAMLTASATPVFADEADTSEAAAVTDAGASGDVSQDSTAAEEETPAVADFPVVDYPTADPVNFGGANYFSLQRVLVFNGDKGRYASFTVSLYNGGSTELKAADYWVKLQNKSGDTYKVQMVSADQAIETVAPKSNEEFTYFAQVGDQTTAQDLVVTPFEWDFSLDGFERDLGSFTIPDDYSSVTPAASARIVRLSDESVKTYVSRPQLLKGPNDQLITASFRMENQGDQTVTVPNLKFFIRTASGSIFDMEDDMASNLQIQPQGGRTIEISVSVPASVDVSSNELFLALTDTGAKTDYAIADYALPDVTTGDELLTPTGVVLPVDIDGNAVDTWVDKVSTTKYVDKQQVGLYYNWQNQSNVNVTIPDYGFMLRTKDGSTYPMTVSGLKGLNVQPKEKKQVQASVIIPSGIPLEDLSLIVYKSNTGGQDKKLIFPAAFYKVEAAKSGGNGDRSETFTDDNGLYRVTINGLQRLPWQDQDQITASLNISNESDTSLPIPKLSAYFELDGVADIDASIVQMDGSILLPAHGSISLMALGNVPYDNKFNEVDLVLQEKVGDVVSDLVNFNLPSTSANLAVIGPGESYTFPVDGHRAKVSIHDIWTYSGEFDANNTYFVELEVENAEKRFNEMTRWVGYFKTKDDIYFPATISDFRQKVSPEGRVLLSFYSKLPRNYTWDQLQLLLGEAVTGNSLSPYGKTDASGKTAADPAPDGLVNAVLFNMPGEAAPKSDYTGMEIGPYTLSLSNIEAGVDTKNVMKFDFDYDLRKNTAYDTSLDGHQFIVQFASGDLTFEQNLDLDKGETSLTLGTGSYELKKTVPQIYQRIPGLDQFKLRLYDEFQGQRRLLADENLDWFTANNQVE